MVKSWRKEGNVLFNDALNTFYLPLYGVRHMVEDHSDNEGLLFPINSKGSFICIIPDRIIHTTTFVAPVVEHWLECEIAQWVHPMKDRSEDPSHHERTLLPRSYISLPSNHDACVYETYPYDIGRFDENTASLEGWSNHDACVYETYPYDIGRFDENTASLEGWPLGPHRQRRPRRRHRSINVLRSRRSNVTQDLTCSSQRTQFNGLNR